jgi:hypothetical protein
MFVFMYRNKKGRIATKEIDLPAGNGIAVI